MMLSGKSISSVTATGFQVGDRVADMTVLGSNAAYRTLRADRLVRVPADVDAAEAATLVGGEALCPLAPVTSIRDSVQEGDHGVVAAALGVLQGRHAVAICNRFRCAGGDKGLDGRDMPRPPSPKTTDSISAVQPRLSA
jgi:NADPH:quinone reductase-like Zn-dependent oxidoreductase